MTITHAIVRRPGENFCDGITTANLGKPDHDKTLQQHAAYCNVLRTRGLEVVVLPAEERYPDGVFVEDTAIVTEHGAIITRAGLAARNGEHDAVEAALADFKQIEHIESPGLLDGGDVLRVDDHFFIGLSDRTDQAGADQVAAILTRCGYSASTVPVEGVLHLKTGITQAADGLLLAAPEFAKHPAFAAFDVLEVAPGEDYCANCLLVNGRLIMPSGFSQTFGILQARGIAPLTVDMSEFRKMDGGLTCLSLLW